MKYENEETDITIGTYYYFPRCDECHPDICSIERQQSEPFNKVRLKLDNIYDTVSRKKELHCRNNILRYLVKYHNDTTYKKINERSNFIFNNITGECKYDPYRIKETFAFFNRLPEKTRKIIYNYQLENVEWMLNLEQNIETVLVPENHVRIFKDMFLDTHRVVLDINPEIEYKQIKFNSGCLMDVMGMGKSLSTISLISASEKKKTLIITDNQLCSHWKGEINAFSELNCIIVSSKKQFKATTLNQINNADIIITSYEFLKNKDYKLRIKDYEINKYSNDYKYYIDRMAKEVVLDGEDTRVPFNLVKWDRVILDECHGIFKKNLGSYINSLECGFKWMVSGTPFTDKASFDTHIDFFGKFSDVINDIKLDRWRKNTLESVSREMKIPGIIEDVEYLNFTSTERDIYDALGLTLLNTREYDQELRKICCFPNLSRELRTVIKSFDSVVEIKEALLKHNNKEVLKLEELLKKYSINLKVVQNMVSVDDTFSTSVGLNLQRDIEKTEAALDKYKRRGVFLSRDIEKEFKCPFCFEFKENPVVTICGHSYCEGCYIQMYKSIKSCGICREKLTEQSVVKLREKERNASKYGTKISAIIRYIHGLKNEKIILFTEWDCFIPKMKNILQEHGIKSIVCRGSIFQKNKSIETFKKSKSGCVILLSTSNSANGINLTCSNNIIFLEPTFDPDCSEKQAIARAHRIGQTRDITIKRFIIKESIEESIHSKRLFF